MVTSRSEIAPCGLIENMGETHVKTSFLYEVILEIGVFLTGEVFFAGVFLGVDFFAGVFFGVDVFFFCDKGWGGEISSTPSRNIEGYRYSLLYSPRLFRGSLLGSSLLDRGFLLRHLWGNNGVRSDRRDRWVLSSSSKISSHVKP